MSQRIFDLAIVVLVMAALFRPAGPIGNRLVQWKKVRAVNEQVVAVWDSLGFAARLDGREVPLRLVEFVDYECTICQSQERVIDSLMRDSSVSGLGVVHAPLTRYRRSAGAAIAAICAEEQGFFVAMHRQLFANQDWVSDADFAKVAIAAGVPDVPRINVCVGSGAAVQKLAKHQEWAQKLGIRGTPAYVNPRIGRHVGSMTPVQFVDAAKE